MKKFRTLLSEIARRYSSIGIPYFPKIGENAFAEAGADFVELHGDKQLPEEFPLPFTYHVRQGSEQEIEKIQRLNPERVIIHPDQLEDNDGWRQLGEKLLIENLDFRNPDFRTIDQIEEVLRPFPEAGICLDVAHTTDDQKILEGFLSSPKVKQMHLSQISLDNGEHLITIDENTWDNFLYPAIDNFQNVPVVFELSPDAEIEDFRTVISKLTK